MKILLVYPRYPETFWSLRHALKFISKKANLPPLGLLTVAAMLPGNWHKKLVDMNVSRLTDEDIKWADYVFISAMAVQRSSVKEVIARCKKLGTKTVAGGPLFTTGYEDFNEIDYFVLNEAEVTLPPFLEDIQKGCARRIYSSTERPDISQTPIPLWSLIQSKYYSQMILQYSRGCPFNCEFCDIIILNGQQPRTKGKEQVLSELETLYQRRWRGDIFIVDDNFIGNKKKIKTDILPALTEWQKRRKYPFGLGTQASINLADDDDLLKSMVEAGFNAVFIGIETPNEESLVECAKSQNQNRDLLAAIKKIQNFGLEVQGGFILGFDSDPFSIFNSQVSFIQKSGIVTAMVGLLNAIPGTRLHQRLKRENRLLNVFVDNNTDCSLNFIPKMNYEVLINGYKDVLNTIYSPDQYSQRVRTFLKEYKQYKPRGAQTGKLQFNDIRALFQSMWVLGIRERGRRSYWRLFLSSLLKRPRKFPLTIRLAIMGYHFRKVAESYAIG